jgi:peptidoglycan/xylan/chitin deacetylase (PgdA/CDA1 family)
MKGKRHCDRSIVKEEKVETINILRESTLSEKNVKLLGRTYIYQDVLWLAYSASGAEFTFEGTECSINFLGDNMAYSSGEDIHRARVAIYVNDQLVVDDFIDSAKKSFDVFKSETVEKVTVRIVKLSETTDSTIGIESVRVVGTSIKKTKENELRIEFIGDSITCGYGVDGELGDTYSTRNENTMIGYAYQTAIALDADYSLVSISGYGVISGYTGDSVKNETSIILPYYDKIGKSYGRIAAQIEPETIAWDFTKFVPNLIVINLGTNDASYCGTNADRCKEYEAGYKEFIKAVRTHNPNAKIICTLGIMGDYLYPYMENAVEAYKIETKDDNIATMKFDVQALEDGFVVDYHPSKITHIKAAGKLTKFIQTMLGKEVSEKATDAKLVAFTFDDGPVAWAEDSTASMILNTFQEYSQRATFFYVGKNVNPNNSKEILLAQELGCEIANHTWSHKDLTTLSEADIKEEVDKTSAVLSNVTGQTYFLIRHPYLSYNDTVLSTMNAPCISCSVDTMDWNNATKDDIVKIILTAHENGTLGNSVVLLHETYKATQEAIAYVVPKLIEEGYQLVTVSELASRNGVILIPGQIYTKIENK